MGDQNRPGQINYLSSPTDSVILTHSKAWAANSDRMGRVADKVATLEFRGTNSYFMGRAGAMHAIVIDWLKNACTDGRDVMKGLSLVLAIGDSNMRHQAAQANKQVEELRQLLQSTGVPTSW